IPRQIRAAFASLAARAGVGEVGIRLLRSVLRPDTKAPVQATDEEKGEYAHCLIKLGATEEALQLLAMIRGNYPQALFYEAAARISRWDYAPTIPLFKKYIASPGVTSYQKLVGKVNLASVLVHQRKFREASYLLRDIVYETGIRRLPLLQGNALQFAACN